MILFECVYFAKKAFKNCIIDSYGEEESATIGFYTNFSILQRIYGHSRELGAGRSLLSQKRLTETTVLCAPISSSSYRILKQLKM